MRHIKWPYKNIYISQYKYFYKQEFKNYLLKNYLLLFFCFIANIIKISKWILLIFIYKLKKNRLLTFIWVTIEQLCTVFMKFNFNKFLYYYLLIKLYRIKNFYIIKNCFKLYKNQCNGPQADVKFFKIFLDYWQYYIIRKKIIKFLTIDHYFNKHRL
jgi:hypothetical protein